MKNYKMIITYDGTRYYGWEHQPTTDMTIQGKLESVLSAMTGTEVEVIGAGRTDAGVHAKGMVANAHMETKMKEDEICDVEAMKRAADILTGEHDFASFCGNPKMKKSTVREIYSIDVSLKGSFLNLTYHGSGFLQYMVRILSGTLLEVGQGKRTPESMYELLEERNRSLAGATAPAKGLCLLKVDYSKEA